MKKSVAVVGLVAALAVAYGASSWYIGQRAQDTIESAVAKGNSHLGKVLGEELSTQPVQLSISQYDRGWFSSRIIYSLKFRGAGGDVTEFLLADKLHHGPLPWSGISQGQFAPVLARSHATLMPSLGSQRWFDALKGKSPLHIKSHLALNGSGQSDWHFEAVDFTTDDGSKLSFGGGHLKMLFASDFETVTTEGHFPLLSAKLVDDDQLVVEGVKFNKSYAFGPNQTAKVNFDISEARYVGTDNETLRLQGLTLAGDSIEKDGLFDGTARYETQSLQFSDINLGKLSAGFQVGRLDLKSLQALTAEYDEILAEQGLSGDEFAELDSKDVLRLREHLFELLKAKPTLALDPFIWDNGDGQSKLSAKVDLVRPDFSLIDATDEELLLKIMGQVDLSVSLAKSMFAKTYVQVMAEGEDAEKANAMARMMFDMYAGMLAKTGLAKYTDGVLSSAIRYKDQKVVVNGKTFTIPEFLDKLSLPDL